MDERAVGEDVAGLATGTATLRRVAKQLAKRLARRREKRRLASFKFGNKVPGHRLNVLHPFTDKVFPEDVHHRISLCFRVASTSAAFHHKEVLMQEDR